MVSEEELYLLSTSLRRTGANPAQWKNEKIRSHPEVPTLKRTKSLMSGECEEVLSICSRGSHCRKRHCNCDHGEPIPSLLDTAPLFIPSNTTTENVPALVLPVLPDLPKQSLEVLLENLTSEEGEMFTDLMHSIVNSSLQDMLREEMDEGHRPAEPAPRVLDLMSNTWEDVFQNPFDYMLNAIDSCPNCGRQITLSRMAPHIVNRCTESRSADDRGKRRAKRDRQRERVSPVRSTRIQDGSIVIDSAIQTASMPVLSATVLRNAPVLEDDSTASTLQLNGCRSSPGLTVAGSRIASISEKLLRSKRRISSSPNRVLARGMGLVTNVMDDCGDEREVAGAANDNGGG